MLTPIVLAQAGGPSTLLVLALSMGIMAATLVGFGFGYWLGRNELRWQLNRLAKDAAKLLPKVIGQLDAAEQACRRLQALPRLNLSSQQTSQLEKKQTGLIDSLGQLLKRLQPESQESKQSAAEPVISLPRWNREQLDYALDMPEPASIRKNLNALVDYLNQPGQTAGLLLLKMNKAETFKERFGPSSAEDLFKQLGNLAKAALREGDLVSRFDDNTFCIMLPATDLKAGTEFAHQLRHTIRHGSFRLKANDSEVLLTASLGYTFCSSTDTAELILSRALKSLKYSESKGRNQLFVHSGSSEPRCVVTP